MDKAVHLQGLLLIMQPMAIKLVVAHQVDKIVRLQGLPLITQPMAI